MEGLFQIVIVLVFVVVSILDGISRKKRQEEQKERMRRNESAEEGVLLEDGLEDLGALEYEADEMEPAAKASSGAESEAGERQTSDQLVPADLWAILTGQKPMPQAPGTPTPEPASEAADRTQSEAASAEAEVGRDWWFSGRSDEEEGVPIGPPVVIPEPVRPAGAERRGAQSGTRRSARWMEGLDREPHDVRISSRPVPDGLDAASVWGAYQDISAGEIGSSEEDGLRYDEGMDEPPGREASSGRRTTASRYAQLVTSGREEDLRSAIVLREVLGPPVGQQERNWD